MGVVVIAAVVILVVTGGIDLGSDDEEDPLALADAPTTVEEDERTDSQASTDAASAAAGSVSAVDASSTMPYRINQPFQYGDLRILITELLLSESVSEGSDELEAIEQFASVSVTVRNTGATPRSLRDSLQLIDGDERLFTASGEATAAAARRAVGRGDGLETVLQPGISTDLVVVFEVPEGVEEFRLRVSGGYVYVSLE